MLQQLRKMSPHAFGQDVDVVSPFEHTDDAPTAMALGQLDDEIGQLREVLGLEPQRSDRVESMTVEAGADQNELRFDPRGKGFQLDFKGLPELLACNAKWHRDVAGVSQTLARSRFLAAPRAGIKREAVNGKKTDSFAPPENVLSSIPVMDVPVHDEDSIQLEFVKGRFGGDGHAVQQTEPHGIPWESMVPRGTDEADCRPVFALQDSVDGIDEASRGKSSHVKRLRAHQGVRFNVSPSGAGEFSEPLEVFGKVDPPKLLVRRLNGWASSAFPSQPTVLDVFLDAGQTDGTFGMSPCLVRLKKGIRIE